MRKLRTFWYTLIKSASEPLYYIDVLRSKFSFSFKFYLLLLLILSIVDVGLFRVRNVPKFITDVDHESQNMVSQLPEKFSASYSAGKLTTNGITLPFSITAGPVANTYGINGTVISITKEESMQSKSLLTLSPTQIYIQGNDNQSIQSATYKDLFATEKENWTLNKNQIEQNRKDFLSSLPKMANMFMLLAIPLWFVGLFLGTTFTLLLLTVIANSFAWILGIRMPLVKTLQMGLHAIAVATLIDVIKFAIFPETNVSLVIPGYLGIMTIALWTIRTQGHKK